MYFYGVMTFHFFVGWERGGGVVDNLHMKTEGLIWLKPVRDFSINGKFRF